MRIPSKTCDRVAMAWCKAISEAISPDTVPMTAVDLARAAFYLYYLEWPDKNIKDWNWPFAEAAEAVKWRHSPATVNAVIAASFSGCSERIDASAPWNVLLREAMRVILTK